MNAKLKKECDAEWNGILKVSVIGTIALTLFGIILSIAQGGAPSAFVKTFITISTTGIMVCGFGAFTAPLWCDIVYRKDKRR